MKSCHYTTVHRWNDTRIFHKMCTSLARKGWEVDLIAPGEADAVIHGVRVKCLPFSGSRLKRATVFAFRVYRAARKTEADIYHFHDPELIWTGILLRLSGRKVVFDVHENIRAQIKVKKWLPFRRFWSALYSVVDFFVQSLFFLVLAESSYRSLYRRKPLKTEVVMNYPDTAALSKFIRQNRADIPNGIFYVGGVTFERGIQTVMDALLELHEKNVPFHFHCVGPVSEEVRLQLLGLDKYAGFTKQVTFYGSLDVLEAYRISLECKVGLSILLPIENYMNSYSTKIFEYMAVGLPVITSDFPLYRDVVERHRAGLCVDPSDPCALEKAIAMILNDPSLAHELAKNGLESSAKEFNWEPQFEKMLALYNRLLKS